jgi:hypothetical protein
MAIYPIINKETGEKQVIEMSVNDITQWYQNNQEWKRDWSEGCATPGEVGEWKDKLVKSKPGWNEVLERAQKGPSVTQKFKI